MSNETIEGKEIFVTDSADGIFGMSNESAVGTAQQISKSAQGTFNQTNQVNMISDPRNDQASAGGLFTSSQSTDTSNTGKKNN